MSSQGQRAFRGRIGVVQRVLASYRAPLFDLLAGQPGVEVSVFAGDPASEEGIKTAGRLDEAEFVRGRNRRLSSPLGIVWWQSGLRRWLLDYRPDALVVEANPRLISSNYALIWSRRHGRPIVAWGLGELTRAGSVVTTRARRAIARTFIRRFDGVLAYSSKGALDYEALGVSRERIEIAYNAVDTRSSEAFLSKLEEDRSWEAQRRAEIGFPDDGCPNLLFVGRLSKGKRLELLIDALIPLQGRCRLLVVGEGPERAALERRAAVLGHGVRFLGHRDGEDLAQLFLLSNGFVLPGLGGLALHQAMSYGRPAIVSRADGTEGDLVQDGVNGYFFSPGDSRDLRETIRRFLDRGQWSQMGAHSLAVVRDKVNLPAMVVSFLSLLGRLQMSIEGPGSEPRASARGGLHE